MNVFNLSLKLGYKKSQACLILYDKKIIWAYELTALLECKTSSMQTALIVTSVAVY